MLSLPSIVFSNLSTPFTVPTPASASQTEAFPFPPFADTVMFSGAASLNADQTALAQAVRKLADSAEVPPSSLTALREAFFAGAASYFSQTVQESYKDIMAADADEDPLSAIQDGIADYAQEHVSMGFLPTVAQAMGRSSLYMDEVAELLGLDEEGFSDKLYGLFDQAIEDLKASVAEE